MIASDRVLALSPEAVMRIVSGEAVILMTRSGQIYTGNPTAADFLGRLDGTRTVGDIVTELSAQYDVESDALIRDLDELLAYLSTEGVVADAN